MVTGSAPGSPESESRPAPRQRRRRLTARKPVRVTAVSGISVLPGGLRVSVRGTDVTLGKSMSGSGSCTTA